MGSRCHTWAGSSRARRRPPGRRSISASLSSRSTCCAICSGGMPKPSSASDTGQPVTMMKKMVDNSGLVVSAFSCASVSLSDDRSRTAASSAISVSVVSASAHSCDKVRKPSPRPCSHRLTVAVPTPSFFETSAWVRPAARSRRRSAVSSSSCSIPKGSLDG